MHFILHQPIILGSMILDFFATFFSSANTLLPFITRDMLHVGVQQYGWLSAAQSIGAVRCALVISQRTRIRGRENCCWAPWSVLAWRRLLFGFAGVSLVDCGRAHPDRRGDSVSTILRNTIRQLQTPDDCGPMVSINQIFFRGGPQLGESSRAWWPRPSSHCHHRRVGLALWRPSWWPGRWPQLRKYNGDEPIVS